MLDLLARHSRIDITVKAKGDLHIDHHHTTEDVGIALGAAVKQALGDMKGITRYADVHVPMDEALTRVALDISGRPFLVFEAQFVRDKVGSFDTELVREWFQTFAVNGGLTLHVTHHLFPEIAHTYLPDIAPIVEATAAEYGVPYRKHTTIGSAVRAHYRLLKYFAQPPTADFRFS